MRVRVRSHSNWVRNSLINSFCEILRVSGEVSWNVMNIFILVVMSHTECTERTSLRTEYLLTWKLLKEIVIHLIH